MMIDLAPEYLNIVRNILRQYVPDAQVWAFGSRVTWTAKEFSDLDLVIIHDELIPADNMVQIAEDLSESNLPIKIDILEWRSISEEFRKEITKQHYSIYKYRLGEIGNIVTGKTPITRFSHYFGKDIPFITPRDMDDTRYITETDRSLSIDGARSVKSAMIPKNSIVVSCIGSDMGKIAIAREKSVTNQQINSLIVNDENDFLYVYYSLCTKRHELRSIASGSALPILNKSDFEKIEIDLPSLETQKETAHILGTLDDKIELNRRMNNTLEEIAQALFKHWFIDFEFPNEEGKPYKSSGGEMVDSELGLIPKGWGVGGIEDMGTICGGSTPSTKNQKYWGGNTPFVTPKDLTSLTSLYLVSTERRITLDGVKRISSGVLPENTILLSSRAPIGYIALLIEPSSVNQGFIAIQCKNPRFIQYVLLWLSSNIDLIKQYANGSTFLEISKDNFRRIKIVIPGHDVIDEFNKCCVSLFTLMKHTTLALSQLVQIRQQLLVYLINSI